MLPTHRSVKIGERLKGKGKRLAIQSFNLSPLTNSTKSLRDVRELVKFPIFYRLQYSDGDTNSHPNKFSSLI